MRKLMTYMIAAGVFAVASPAMAATTVLTFEGFACTGTDGGTVDRNCVNQNDFIGVNYGSTAQLAVSYNASDNSPTGGAARTSLVYRFPPFGSGATSLVSTGTGTEAFSRIFLTPAAGFEVALNSFKITQGTATTAGLAVELLDANNNIVYSFIRASGGAQSFAPNTAYYAGPLTFRYNSNNSGTAVIDDFTFDVRAIAVTGTVPEPASWAMMLAGFGVVGGVMRRRTNAITLLV